MTWIKRLSIVSLICLAANANAQTPITIDSHGDDIQLHVWAAAETPAWTLLLVPGWGGGGADVLGIGEALSKRHVTVVVLTPRGWRDSEGTATFAHALEDIAVTLSWIRTSGKPGLVTRSVVLGGHSWGGGMSLAYAAQDESVARVFSVAGTDHAIFIRRVDSDGDYGKMMRKVLDSTRKPDGPINFDVEKTLAELRNGQDTYGLLENADELATRDILLIGGWDDTNVTVEDTMLPLYRALKKAGAESVSFRAFQDNHGFRQVRPKLHAEILDWIDR